MAAAELPARAAAAAVADGGGVVLAVAAAAASFYGEYTDKLYPPSTATASSMP